MDNIENLRKDIDKIDKEMVELFERRMEISVKVAKYKKSNGMEVLDSSREEEIINKNISRLKNEKFSESLKDFFKAMFSISRAIQDKYL